MNDGVALPDPLLIEIPTYNDLSFAAQLSSAPLYDRALYSELKNGRSREEIPLIHPINKAFIASWLKYEEAEGYEQISDNCNN